MMRGCRISSSAVYSRHCLVSKNVVRRQYSSSTRGPENRLYTGRSHFYYVITGILISTCTASYLLRPSTGKVEQTKNGDLEQINTRNYKWPKLGISQISLGSCQSNQPGEDTVDLQHFDDRKLGYFGIYDGHNGGDLSNVLRETFLSTVSAYLHLTYDNFLETNGQRRPPSTVIDDAIRRAFLDQDNKFVHGAAQHALGIDKESYKKLNGGFPDSFESTSPTDPPSQPLSKHEAVKMLKLANAGSCAMVGIFDAEDRTLRLALTGDLRAVFGRRVQRHIQESEGGDSEKTYVYEVEALTTDQNAYNPSEVARLKAEHPDEEDLLKDGRVLGWGPSRAFGDGTMKWSRAVRERLKRECLGDAPRENYKTPPYFIAEPVITRKEGIRKGDFVILATDGLWESFENEEAVGLVGQWLETHGKKENVWEPDTKSVREVIVPPDSGSSGNGTIAMGHDGKTYTPFDLPVIYPPNFKDNTPRYRYWRAEKKFVCEDKDSVTQHLIRNALGGADKDLHNALLEYKPPRSRRFRDDITVVVIFFD